MLLWSSRWLEKKYFAAAPDGVRDGGAIVVFADLRKALEMGLVRAGQRIVAVERRDDAASASEC
jgi:hypothetical protein